MSFWKKKKKEEIDDGLDFSPWPMSADGPGLPAPMGTVMSDETKQRILLKSSALRASGNALNDQMLTMPLSTGTYPQWGNFTTVPTRAYHQEIDTDALWEKMYAHMRKVIVVCKYCERPQTIDNEVCSGCGAPLPVEYL